jgi:DNA-directed RNA polymerase subunit RPC12/RpoP
VLTAAEFRLVCQRAFPSRDPRTRCPHCRAKLAGQPALVIASRNCPECGGRVLADPPEPDEPVELIPEPEFTAAARRFESVVLTVVAGGLLTWAFSFCLGTALAGSGGPVGFLPPEVLLLWSLLGPPAITAVLVVAYVRRAKWDPALVCPRCGEVNPTTYPTIRATGRCPSCGHTMLAGDEPPPAPTAPLLPAAEFAARLRARGRASTRSTWLFSAVLVGLIAPCALPVAVLGRFEAEIRLTRRIGEDKAYALMEYGPAPGLVGALLAAGAASGVYYLRAVRRSPLACPHCGKAFALTGVVLASRRCDHCLRPAVADKAEDPTC